MQEENGMSGQQESEMLAGGLQDGGRKGWFTGHKILTGVGMGILAALLLVGMFFVGYLVGSENDERGTKGPDQRVQQLPARPDMRSAPSPGDEEAGPGRLDILREYHDELLGVIAGKLGISVDELEDEIAGKTIADIAEAQGVSTDDLAAAVAAKIGEIADKLVGEDEMTSQQAEIIKSRADDMAARLIERGLRMQPMPPG